IMARAGGQRGGDEARMKIEFPLSGSLREPPLPRKAGARKRAKLAAAFPRPIRGERWRARRARRRGGFLPYAIALYRKRQGRGFYPISAPSPVISPMNSGKLVAIMVASSTVTGFS